MILRYKLYSIAGATALLSTPRSGDAFTRSTTTSRRIRSPSTPITSTTSRLHSNLSPDWNNDDFLSSLDKGSEQIEDANDKYYKQQESRAAMDNWRAKQLEKEMEEQQQQQQKEAAARGASIPRGSQYGPTPEQMAAAQNNMAASQQQQQMQPPPPLPPPQQTQPPQQQQHQQLYDANGNPVSMPMVYDAHGNLVPFNPSAVQQPPPPAQQPVVQPQVNPTPTFDPNVPNALEPPTLPARSKGADNNARPVGYNTDSYSMSNTADVYFAQLKQDSKVRKMARLSGDTDTANQVFGDESVKQLGDSWNENPYTKEQNYEEARAEIEGTVRMQVMGGDDTPSITSRISYKERLAQKMKASRFGADAVEGSSGIAQPALDAIPADEEPLEQPPQPALSAIPADEEPLEPQPRKKVGVPMLQKILQNAGPPPEPEPVAATTSPSSGAVDEGDVRNQIRNAQGLLLKHRGGPGFGAGRLKEPEAQRLENTLECVKGILRSEVGDGPAPRTMPAAQATPTPAQAATLVSTTAQSSPPTHDPLAGSVACVEAVLNMYKNSPPGEREAMMVPLREALMAAAGASNQYIAETELSAHRAAMDAGPAAGISTPSMENTQPMMGFPTTYAVAKPAENESTTTSNAEPAAAATITSGDKAENDQKLEDVYNALKEASGVDGKLGLKGLSGDEATELMEKLVTMRSVLLDELNE